jgi:SpoVK/Ycf46/Vps4 family AAA+-type ATPase
MASSIGSKLFLLSASASALALAFLVYKKLSVSEQEIRGSQNAEKLMARGRLIESLTAHETMLCADLVFPEDLTVGFDDVAGLESVKSGLRDVMKMFESAASSKNESKVSKLRLPPKGILLHGPPGNGKTMMAAAMAKEMGSWSFLPILASTLFQKYYGESEKVRCWFVLHKKKNFFFKEKTNTKRWLKLCSRWLGKLLRVSCLWMKSTC